MNTQVNFTMNEIFEDHKYVKDCASTEAKKQMCEKYGIQSNKTSEIAQKILEVGLDIHRQRTEFDHEDIRVFNTYWNYPASAKKIREAFEQETEAFIQFYLENMKKQYALNPARRWLQPTIRLTESYLYDRKNANNPDRDALVLALDVQLKEFHDTYIKRHLEFADWKFNTMIDKYKDIRTMKDIYEKLQIDDRKRAERVYKMINTFRVESGDFDREYYLERTRRNVEAVYLNNITVIATRIMTAKMNLSKIKVQRVSDTDPKAFKMHVTDGTRQMYARSIWCAEESVIVTPHWRFIITDTTNCK